MEELRTRIRKFYFTTLLIPIIVFGITYIIFVGATPVVAEKSMRAYYMIGLLGVAFLLVGASSFIMHRANTKRSGLEDQEQAKIFEPAFRTRMICLSATSLMSSVCYALTHEPNTIYLVAILAVMQLLSYPTEQFFMKR